MKKIRMAVLLLVVCVCAFVVWDLLTYGDYIDAFSGATPKALKQEVPRGISLKVNGLVASEWELNRSSFRLLAKTRLRTREISPSGEILGAYIYSGVTAASILEGVDPEKPADEVFDGPLDILVEFTSVSGATSVFTYGELVLADDRLPVLLAYHREQVLPEKDPELYRGNRYTENITGLRLVCPGDSDTGRYLDQVVSMTLKAPVYPVNGLPETRKHFKCVQKSLFCRDLDTDHEADFYQLNRSLYSGWFRIGHGRGIKETFPGSAAGFNLAEFLKKNFNHPEYSDIYIFIGCDGYRVALSGREILAARPQKKMMIIDTVDGKINEGGVTLAVFSDFYIDRFVRELAWIVRIRGSAERGAEKKAVIQN